MWYRATRAQPFYIIDARGIDIRTAEHQKVHDRVHFRLDYPIGYLHIAPVYRNDSGEYRCRVDFRRGRTINRILRLQTIGKRKKYLKLYPQLYHQLIDCPDIQILRVL